MASAVAFAYLRDFSDVVLHLRFSNVLCLLHVCCINVRMYRYPCGRPPRYFKHVVEAQLCVEAEYYINSRISRRARAKLSLSRFRIWRNMYSAQFVSAFVPVRLSAHQITETVDFSSSSHVLSVKLSASCSEGVADQRAPVMWKLPGTLQRIAWSHHPHGSPSQRQVI